jgi:hypothetical protein
MEWQKYHPSNSNIHTLWKRWNSCCCRLRGRVKLDAGDELKDQCAIWVLNE